MIRDIKFIHFFISFINSPIYLASTLTVKVHCDCTFSYRGLNYPGSSESLQTKFVKINKRPNWGFIRKNCQSILRAKTGSERINSWSAQSHMVFQSRRIQSPVERNGREREREIWIVLSCIHSFFLVFVRKRKSGAAGTVWDEQTGRPGWRKWDFSLSLSFYGDISSLFLYLHGPSLSLSFSMVICVSLTLCAIIVSLHCFAWIRFSSLLVIFVLFSFAFPDPSLYL